MSVVVVNVYLRERYLAYQVLHIIVWERANGCDCSDKPFRKGVFTLNTLHDVPHSRAHVERKDIAPVPGDASRLQQAEETKQERLDITWLDKQTSLTLYLHKHNASVHLWLVIQFCVHIIPNQYMFRSSFFIPLLECKQIKHKRYFYRCIKMKKFLIKSYRRTLSTNRKAPGLFTFNYGGKKRKLGN